MSKPVRFNEIATPFALLLLILFHFTLALQYNIKTFISDENMIETESYNSSEVKLKNLTIKTQFITLKKTLGLAGIIEKVSLPRKKLDGQSLLYTSYVGRETKIISEIYSANGEEFYYSFHATSCSMVFDKNIHLHKSCMKYMPVYAEAIKALMYIVLDVPILIVTDKDPCSIQFSKILHKTLKGSVGKHGKIYEVSVDQHKQLTSDFYGILYTVTTKFIKTIILLCNEVVVELLFTYVRNNEFLRSSKIWITVGLAPQIDDVIAPSQMLNLKYQGLINYEKLMPAISFEVARDVNTRLVASLEKDDNILSQLDATSFTGQSSNSLREASCKARDKNSGTVVVSNRKTKFTWTPLYHWTQENKMILLSKTENNIWLSRSVTHKTSVKVTTILEEPFVSLAKDFYDESLESCRKGFKCKVPANIQNHAYWTCCIGYSMDILEKLQTDLRIKVDLHLVKDGFYGSLFNGTWNGMIGELIRGEADLLMAPITTTTKRSYFVEFGEIYMEITLVIIIPTKQAHNLQFLNFGFVRSVSSDLLLGLLSAFIFGTILLYFLENRLMVNKHGNNYHYRFKECFTYFSGITFQRDLGGKNPTRSAARITAIAIAFAMVCIMSSYCAQLTAEKVTTDGQEPFLGMADRKMTHPTTDFKFATVKSSSMEDYFRFSEDPTVRSMHLFMKDFNVKSNDIGIKKLLNGELQAYITEHPVAEYYVSKDRDCGLRIVKTKGKASWSVVFPKGSPWNHLVSNKIMQYKEQGFIGQLNAKWLRSSCSIAKSETLTIGAFKIENFGGLIIILLGTFAVLFVILLLETVLCRYWTQTYSINDSNVEEPS